MAPSRPAVTSGSSWTKALGAGAAPKPAGVTKFLPRTRAAAQPVARSNTTTTTRPATRAYAKRVTALKNEESAEPALKQPEPKLNAIPARPPSPATSPFPPAPIITRFPLQPSPLPAPLPPRKTESELESLMTIGREQIEKELKERIAEEQDKKRVLQKQKTAYARYHNYLTTLKDLEDELRELKEENHVDEETVLEQAELFQRNTMRWAKLFEEYAGGLGITVFDVQRLGSAW